MSLLLIVAGARFFWPDLPIDTTLVGLLGLAYVAAKWEVESLEFLGVKARRRAARLKEAESKLKALGPPPRVETPATPPRASAVPTTQDWYERAAAVATDLDMPSEPTARILWAAEQIRIELIILAGNSGHLQDRTTPWSALSSRKLASTLTSADLIPSALTEAIPPFLEIRNRVAHGHRVADALADSAESMGLSLVTTLRAVPREWIRVIQADIRIYADRSKTLRHSVGVMLVQLDESGAVKHRAVYPGPGFFPKGSFVTWEWDSGRSSAQEGWYDDPVTGEPTLAWSESMVFVGRPYPDEWGLMYRFPRPEVGFED